MNNNVTEIYRKVLPRLLVLSMLIIAFNSLYRNVFWEKDLKKEAFLLPIFMDLKDSVDVLYFGESSNFFIHPDDSIKGRISDLIAAWYPSLKFGTVNKPAIHAGIYLSFISMLKESDRVKTVVVTLNMRTLNQSTIHSNLESALQKSKLMYNNRPPLLNRFLMSLSFYDNKTDDERDIDLWRAWISDTLVSNEVSFPAPTVKSWCALEKFPLPEGGEDLPKRILADHYVKAYAFQIDTLKNPRIAELDAIVRICKQKGINLVFNLLAENTEYAQKLVGDELLYLMRSNRDLLVNRYRNKGVVVVDNLELVEGIEYVDQEWTTEHYRQKGRLIIAENVAKEMSVIYPKAFNPQPNYNIRSK